MLAFATHFHILPGTILGVNRMRIWSKQCAPSFSEFAPILSLHFLCRVSHHCLSLQVPFAYQAPLYTAMDNHATSCTTAIVASAVVATTVVLSLLKRALWPKHPKIMPSPLNTVLPYMSTDEVDRLEYKPDAFPGSRDVATPYGSIRVYEWGPETGRKVLFVHGISTSSMTLFKIAHALVEEQGCRVMLFVSSYPLPVSFKSYPDNSPGPLWPWLL